MLPDLMGFVVFPNLFVDDERAVTWFPQIRRSWADVLASP
jgi:hypothetical protein